MSVFGRIRNVLGGDTEQGADYVCQSCGRSFELQRQVCPECGGYRIEQSSWGNID